MDRELRTLIDSVKFYIELERESGMRELVAGPAPTSEAGVAGHAGSEAGDLKTLHDEVLLCNRCELAKTRRSVVFGAGSSHAKLMFVGEAPGRDEDIQGLPFVGRAGGLLTKIIEAMGYTRDEVYIANILKCRPPDNRAPLPDEILACADNVRRQVAMIRPTVIVTLGKFASQTLLKTETPISALRGNFHEYEGIKVMPTFHPAYLLRNPDDKKLVWDDMKKVMAVLKK